MRTSITNYVATVIAVLAAGPVGTRASAPTTEEDTRSDARNAATTLRAFLEDGEDGCTCRSDLRELVRGFQEAHNRDPSGRGPRSPNPATGPVPTHGYLEPSTASALAAYTGAWLTPCYGAFTSRCGDVPPDACVEGPVPASGGGGCLPWNFGTPQGGTTCREIRPVSDADATEVERLKARLRAACGDHRVARLVQDWVYDERGCPADGRVAGCRASDPGDPQAAWIEWFYGPARTVDDVRALCGDSGRTLVTP